MRGGGLRLGYLVTANQDFSNLVRAELHIWNINGFGESFLRQAPRYRKAFKLSCALVHKNSVWLYRELSKIPGITAYPPQANFVMCRLPDQAPSGPDITKRLFVEHSILIKHCAGKQMPDAERYLRIASKTEAENAVVVAAIQKCLTL